jgi:hypothetical protein
MLKMTGKLVNDGSKVIFDKKVRLQNPFCVKGGMDHLTAEILKPSESVR